VVVLGVDDERQVVAGDDRGHAGTS
jgi:hypothetical protein